MTYAYYIKRSVRMGNFLRKVLLNNSGILPNLKFVMMAITMLGFFGTLMVAQTNTGISGATSAICLVFNTVKNIIFLLGLTLMLLGAVLYAGGNIMPSNSRGAFQGYGMSMIIGGVVGVAIAVAAPFILNMIVAAGAGTATGSSGILGSTGLTGITSICPSQ